MANRVSHAKGSYYWLALVATLLALVVIMLGAYTRLKDAGLGCPDWPGCYGQMSVPQSAAAVQKAAAAFPGQTIEASKAWLEMIHRYFAGVLGIIVFVLTIWAILRMKRDPQQPIILPILLSILIIYQAILGMWTVTMQLLPLVVMGHLLGGMTIVALLWGLTLSTDRSYQRSWLRNLQNLRAFAVLGVVILGCQIFLGGWTSANYAALICPHFPLCQGSLFPTMNFHEAFNLFHPVGINYEGGVLDTTARVTIQMTHRYGAFITAIYLGCLSLYVIIAKQCVALRLVGWFILFFLLLQFSLGVLNVEWLLPLPIAVAHNGVAALLLLSVATLLYKLYAKPRRVL